MPALVRFVLITPALPAESLGKDALGLSAVLAHSVAEMVQPLTARLGEAEALPYLSKLVIKEIACDSMWGAHYSLILHLSMTD